MAIGVLVALAMPVAAGAQTTFHVADSASLNMAITSAVSGDQIIFDANITLTSDLSSIQADVTIDGAGHTLSGNNQFRGLFITTTTDLVPVNVAIANLTIQNTLAAGGNGGAGTAGGGGGAGLGGALYVANLATVTVSNVNLVGNTATGGSGGAGGTGVAGGGGLFAAMGGGGGMMGGPFGNRSSPITDAAITQAQSVLTATQVTALQQLQAQQQAQRQLSQIVRQTMNGGSAPPSSGTSTAQSSGAASPSAPAAPSPPGG